MACIFCGSRIESHIYQLRAADEAGTAIRVCPSCGEIAEQCNRFKSKGFAGSAPLPTLVMPGGRSLKASVREVKAEHLADIEDMKCITSLDALAVCKFVGKRTSRIANVDNYSTTIRIYDAVISPRNDQFSDPDHSKRSYVCCGKGITFILPPSMDSELPNFVDCRVGVCSAMRNISMKLKGYCGSYRCIVQRIDVDNMVIMPSESNPYLGCYTRTMRLAPDDCEEDVMLMLMYSMINDMCRYRFLRPMYHDVDSMCSSVYVKSKSFNRIPCEILGDTGDVDNSICPQMAADLNMSYVTLSRGGFVVRVYVGNGRCVVLDNRDGRLVMMIPFVDSDHCMKQYIAIMSHAREPGEAVGSKRSQRSKKSSMEAGGSEIDYRKSIKSSLCINDSYVIDIVGRVDDYATVNSEEMGTNNLDRDIVRELRMISIDLNLRCPSIMQTLCGDLMVVKRPDVIFGVAETKPLVEIENQESLLDINAKRVFIDSSDIENIYYPSKSPHPVERCLIPLCSLILSKGWFQLSDMVLVSRCPRPIMVTIGSFSMCRDALSYLSRSVAVVRVRSARERPEKEVAGDKLGHLPKHGQESPGIISVDMNTCISYLSGLSAAQRRLTSVVYCEDDRSVLDISIMNIMKANKDWRSLVMLYRSNRDIDFPSHVKDVYPLIRRTMPFSSIISKYSYPDNNMKLLTSTVIEYQLMS